MRIRKRPPRAVEATRAVPIVGDKPDSISEAVHAEVNFINRSERLTGGSAEVLFQVDTQVRPRDRDAAEGAPEEDAGNKPGSSDKKEDTSSELLMKSLLVVFERAGIRGLTAREAVAKLVEFGLPGLQEGERSSVQVAKVLRTPDFVHLENGKYFIYPGTPHAVVAESSTHSEPSQVFFQAREDVSENSPNFNNGRRKRGAKQKENTNSDGIDVPEKVLTQLELKKRRRRPPSSQHELAIGPRQCKRYDGRGWQCSKETEEGFSFCEHHQALMNKRTLRLNLAKMKRSGSTTTTTTTTTTNKGGSASDEDTIMDAAAAAAESQPVSETSNDQAEPVAAAEAAPHGIEDLIHNQRRKLVKARSLKSIK